MRISDWSSDVCSSDLVGVRALGDVAATAGDFTINAAGKIELAAKASAQHDIRITSSGNQGITLHRAALTATRDIRLSTGGALTLNGGSLIAGRDLALRSEEHTSELQSLMRISYAVFCLKKKQNKHRSTSSIPTRPHINNCTTQ